ncbi:MAG: hypothetical protein IT385_10635 [Deltaproteobacteria bacterium]|nr:hypothetical protein [Deltaproteobacteria bacterium]
MRAPLLRSIVVSIVAASSCGDEQVMGHADSATDTAPADTIRLEVTPDATSTDTTSPVDAALPCQPNPCTSPPPDHCSVDRTAEVAHVATGVCSLVEGVEACDYPDGPATICAGGPCVVGSCLDLAGDKCTWPFTDRISYVSEMRFTGEPACCHDLDGDGTVDNNFGNMLAAVAPVFDYDANLRDQIAGHHMNLLLDFMGLDEPLADPIDDPQVDLVGYAANFDGVVFVDPATGMSSMKLKLSSFLDETTFLPRNRLAARIEGGRLTGWDGRLALVSFGPHDEIVELRFDDVHIEGEVRLGPNGKGLVIDGDEGRGARLWGHVTRQSLLEWLDAEYLQACCSTFSEADGGVPVDPITGTCHTPETKCEEQLGICQALADPGSCATLMLLFSLDVDSDGDGERDAMSFGMRIKATSGQVGWIEGCGPAPTDPGHDPR